MYAVRTELKFATGYYTNEHNQSTNAMNTGVFVRNTTIPVYYTVTGGR